MCLYENPEALYNRDFNPKEILSSLFLFSLFPSPASLFSFSSFFSFPFFLFFSLFSFPAITPSDELPPPASQHQADKPTPEPVAQLASSQPRTAASLGRRGQPGRGDPAQAKSGQPRPDPTQPRPVSPNPFRGQLVRELFRSR